jgi:hypothetical protein
VTMKKHEENLKAFANGKIIANKTKPTRESDRFFRSGREKWLDDTAL